MRDAPTRFSPTNQEIIMSAVLAQIDNPADARVSDQEDSKLTEIIRNAEGAPAAQVFPIAAS